MDPNTLYTLDRSGQQYGPYTLEQLKTYVHQGNIVGSDMVWTAGMPTPMPVSQVLAGAAQAPVPAPPRVPPIPHVGGPGFTPAARAATLTEYRRPAIITLLAVLQFFGAGLGFLMALGLLFTAAGQDDAVALVAGLVGGAVGALELICGIGLWKLKSYGRTIQNGFAWVGLLAIPIGTIISVLILLYLRKPGIQIMFSGLPASQLAPEQAAEVEAVTAKWSGALVAVIVVIAIISTVALVGIVAAIAVPGLLRARMSGNEASAIGTLRAISSAQATYAATCEGYAPNLAALNGAGLLPADMAAASPLARSGYTITLEPSGTAAAAPNPAGGCAGAVTDYIAHAEPVTPGSTGTRYFATNASGVIYQDTTAMSGNRIPATATPIQ